MKRAALVVLCVLACSRKPTSDGALKPEPTPITAASSAPAAPPPSPVPAAAAPAAPCSKGPFIGATVDPNATSPDGRLLAYAAKDPALREPRGDFLCIVRDGGKPEVLLVGHEEGPDAGPEDALADFDELLFSPDGRTLYFSSAAWTTERAAHAVDLATRKERFIHAGRVVATLDGGPWKGMLLVGTTQLDDAHPIGDPGFLGRIVVMLVVSPAGKKLKRLPDDEATRNKVLGTDIGSRATR